MTTALVTGAAGFIGSHLAEALADRGVSVVGSDYMTDDERWKNLERGRISDFVEPSHVVSMLRGGRLKHVDVLFHQGACSDTTERNAAYMFDRNYHQSVDLLHAAQDLGVPFVYASSASVYGNTFDAASGYRAEAPLNTYAYSKLLFDRYVRDRFSASPTTPIVGLRYFNVYGERESHKGRMASVVHHFWHEARHEGRIKLFEGTGEFADGEQRRDFVYVADVVAANLHFGLEAPTFAICDVGTGKPRSYNDLARSVQARTGCEISYIPFPEDLQGRYQHWTCADLGPLHTAGFPTSHAFTELEDGVDSVIDWLEATDAR